MKTANVIVVNALATAVFASAGEPALPGTVDPSQHSSAPAKIIERHGLFYQVEDDGTATKPATGFFVSRYNSGQLKKRGPVMSGKPHGDWEHYHENGQLKFTGSYKNGKGDGPWKGFYKNGQLEYSGSYSFGQRDGAWDFYSDNGKLEQKGWYKHGQKEGPWVFYHWNGRMKSRATYRDGKAFNKVTY